MEAQISLQRMSKFKTASYLLVAAAVLWLLSSQAVSGAILDFCFGGIVPGTNHVLSPDLMIIGALVGIAIICSAGLVFWLLRMRAVRRMMPAVTNHQAVKTPAIAPVAQPSTASDTALPAVETAHDSVSVPHRRRLPFSSMQSSAASAVHRMLSGLRATTVVTRRIALQIALTTYRMFLTVLRRAGAISLTMIAIAAIGYEKLSVYTRRYAARFWRWLQPYALRFDTWLEVRYRTVTLRLKRSLDRFEVMQVLTAMYNECVHTVRQLLRYK